MHRTDFLQNLRQQHTGSRRTNVHLETLRASRGPRSWWVVLAVLGASAAGCSSDGTPGDDAGGSGGTSTVGGSAGTLGKGGSAGTVTGQGGTGGTLGGSSGSGGSLGGGVGGGGTSGTGGGSGTGPAGGAGTGAAGGTAGTGGGAGSAGSAGSAAGGAGSGGMGAMGGSSGLGGRGGATSGGAAGTAPMGGAAGTGGGNVTCPSTVLTPGDKNETVSVGGTMRTYILHVPSAYKGTSAVPLVVDFHPLGGSGSSESSSSPYKAQTDPEGVITAYPNGLSGPSGGAWNVGPCCVKDADDVGFAKALVAKVEMEACIDTKRVYAVGFSMGGGMSHYIACHAADIFAAAAPASFDLLKENQDTCTPPRPVPLISFRSSNDTVVPYDGGASSVVSGMPVTFLGAVNTFKKWGQINGCTDTPAAADSNACQYYKTCMGGVQVGLCTMTSGHAPGKANIGWPFLKQFTLP